MMTRTTVDEQARSTHRRHTIKVARRASGEDLSIVVHVLKGSAPGPVLGLVANIHGDAAYGGYNVHEFIRDLDLDFRGAIMAVPVANPVAFETATRTTGQGWNTDMNNMNRVFPGDHGGWVTQKMAAVVAESVVENIDALIDYHCGSFTTINYTLVNGDQTEDQRRIFKYCRLMGTEFVYVHDEDPFVGTIDQYAKSLGKLSIVAEQGGNVVPHGFLGLSHTRIRNFMKGLDMIDGEPDLPETQLVMRPPRMLPRIAHGGLFVPERGVDLVGTIVDGGTLLSRVLDLANGEVLDEMRAPYERSAMLSARTTLARANPGDYGYIIANADSGERLPRPTDWKVEL